MNKIIVGVLVVLTLLVSGLYFKGGSELLGGGTRMVNGLSTDTTSPSAGQVRTTTLTTTGDATFGGGSGAIVVTTTNTATSSIQVGCVQTTATSTASPVRLTLTPHVGTTTTQGQVSDFLVSAQFGTCP